MKVEKNFYNNFILNLLLSGFVIATINSIMDYFNHSRAGFIYGAIPVTYIYLYFLANKNTDSKSAFAKATIYSIIAWIVFVLFTYLLADKNIFITIFIALIAFSITIYIQYQYAYLFNIKL